MRRQLWIIAKREFLHRFRSKGFLIATFLGPIAMLLLFTVPVGMMFVSGGGQEKEIVVVDETNGVEAHLELPLGFKRVDLDLPTDSLRAWVEGERLAGYLVLPATVATGGSATFYSRGGGGLASSAELRSAVERAVRRFRMNEAAIPDSVAQWLTGRVPFEMVTISEQGDAQDASAILAGVGYAMGFMIYIFMILYGAFVMRGVIEEKTSRISELIASSAKPFDLMMGKVVGIGTLGLVQFGIWIAMGAGIMAFGGSIIAAFLDPEAIGASATADPNELLEAAGIAIPKLPLWMPVYFLLYFLFGYFLYASLYAAVGSAVEQESDAQQLLLPVMVPIIMPMLFITHVLESPESMLSVGLSLVPFFSPILMPVRIAANAASGLEIAASLLLLVLTFLGAIWLCARIYRIGILMYGKKPRFKDLVRWARYA